MATERRDEREEVDDDKEGDRKGYTPRGEPVDIVYMGGDMPPLEGNAYLPEFTPGRAHLLFQGLYGYFPHHNDGLDLDRGVTDDAIWQRPWRRLEVQSASWYATPSGEVGCRFMTILASEWRGVLGSTWNSKRPLIFAHIVLTKTFDICRTREI